MPRDHRTVRSASRRDAALAILALAAYALAHLGIRVAVSGTAELDEAEQLVLTQTVVLGYDDQPPLCTWIQALAFRVLGIGILASASDGLPVAMAQWAARIARMPVETARPPRHVTPPFGGPSHARTG